MIKEDDVSFDIGCQFNEHLIIYDLCKENSNALNISFIQ